MFKYVQDRKHGYTTYKTSETRHRTKTNKTSEGKNEKKNHETLCQWRQNMKEEKNDWE